jgi:hypothetical protein
MGRRKSFEIKNQRRKKNNPIIILHFLPIIYVLLSKRILFYSDFYCAAEIGIALLGVGFALTALGVMLFFEKNLLKFGNILILSGISLFIGPERVVNFFMQPHRMRATIIVLLGNTSLISSLNFNIIFLISDVLFICNFSGSFLVFTGRPRYGIICQFFGFLNLFG